MFTLSGFVAACPKCCYDKGQVIEGFVVSKPPYNAWNINDDQSGDIANNHVN